MLDCLKTRFPLRSASIATIVCSTPRKLVPCCVRGLRNSGCVPPKYFRASRACPPILNPPLSMCPLYFSLVVAAMTVELRRYRISLVNQPYFGGRNTSGHTCTALRAGRNVGLRNARYNLTSSMP